MLLSSPYCQSTSVVPAIHVSAKGSAPLSANSQGGSGVATSGTKERSLDWEEERITTSLLGDALAGTASALDANRHYERSALTSREAPILLSRQKDLLRAGATSISGLPLGPRNMR